MINRYPVRCRTCRKANTLRITLGTDARQEHSFACTSCGEQARVALNIDFADHVRFANFPGLSGPKATFVPLENCEECDEEGPITNLDPNFLVPTELLHKDGVFPWMHEFYRIGAIKSPTARFPATNDIIDGLGGQRNLKEKLGAFVAAWRLRNKDQHTLHQEQLDNLARLTGNAIPSFWHAAVVVATSFLGATRDAEVASLMNEVRSCKQANQKEYERFRIEFTGKYLDDSIERQMSVITDYLQYYNQLFQAWIYATRGAEVSGNVSASSHDLRSTRMFYGNAFEELAWSLALPACLNNIKQGRPFETFQTMDLKKYFSINKAGRAKPFSNNLGFQSLSDEFDSTIRNASHHGATRFKKGSHTIVQYRSGDSGQWQTMTYATYLLKCNRIVMCMMRLLLIQSSIAEDRV